MRYVDSAYTLNVEELTYRIYVSDALKAIGNLDRRYADGIARFRNLETEKTEEELEEFTNDLMDEINGGSAWI